MRYDVNVYASNVSFCAFERLGCGPFSLILSLMYEPVTLSLHNFCEFGVRPILYLEHGLP